MQSKHSQTSFFWRLLSRVSGPQSGEALVGDIQEEHRQRAQVSAPAAAAWLISQYTRALATGLWRQCGTPVGLSRIMLAATVIVLPLLVGLIAWLSHMDETTPQLWNMVLAGEMHKALFVVDYWQVQPYALSQINGLDLFVNFKSAAWALAAMGLVALVGRNNSGSLRAATVLGVALMVVPYVLSILYLDMAQLDPKKIGPIIAFTLFNFFYMLPAMAWWLNRQAAKAEGAHHA